MQFSRELAFPASARIKTYVGNTVEIRRFFNPICHEDSHILRPKLADKIAQFKNHVLSRSFLRRLTRKATDRKSVV